MAAEIPVGRRLFIEMAADVARVKTTWRRSNRSLAIRWAP